MLLMYASHVPDFLEPDDEALVADALHHWSTRPGAVGVLAKQAATFLSWTCSAYRGLASVTCN